MAEWVRQAIGTLPDVEDVAVAIAFEPPWTPDRIARDALLARPLPQMPRASALRSMTGVIPRDRPPPAS